MYKNKKKKRLKAELLILTSHPKVQCDPKRSLRQFQWVAKSLKKLGTLDGWMECLLG